MQPVGRTTLSVLFIISGLTDRIVRRTIPPTINPSILPQVRIIRLRGTTGATDGRRKSMRVHASDPVYRIGKVSAAALDN
jgi:hypothetical protein